MPVRRFTGSAWASAFRQAPIGVLVLGTLLFFVGAGLVMGGVFFALTGRGGSWLAWFMMLVAGPLALSVALNLVLRRRRAWLVVTSLLLLLLASSLTRLITTAGLPISPVLELLVEMVCLAYLFRPRVRRAFRAAV